jgi:hypothetical protein
MKSLAVKWAILSVLFTSIVFGISKCTNLPEEKVWILIDLIQRNTKQTPKEINEYIMGIRSAHVPPHPEEVDQ